MMRSATLLLAALPGAIAATTTVQVATNGLQILPNTVYAQPGDEVRFQFLAPGHSIAQSDYDSPCTPKDGGIYSGVLDHSKTFTITINDTQPIWIYDATSNYCQGGMVMVINPSGDETLNGYRSAASNAKSGALPESMSGGEVADATAAPTSSASETASATGSSSSATSSSGADMVKPGMGVVAAFVALCGCML